MSVSVPGPPDVAAGRREAGFQPAASSCSARPALQPDLEQKQGGPVAERETRDAHNEKLKSKRSSVNASIPASHLKA